MELDPGSQLSVRLSATIICNAHTDDPAALIVELEQIAGGRADLLAREAGLWAGVYEDDQDRQTLAEALAALPGADRWVPVGQDRSGVRHGTPKAKTTNAGSAGTGSNGRPVSIPVTMKGALTSTTGGRCDQSALRVQQIVNLRART
ncbi:hypothetical protein [Microbacterium halotolerans]|uniref:hypothetical protein n=1 Tax=Microbacterium halotolerans TaxID=246613 RepID=UPI000E6AACCE|nr:hypothetical protein [Microbacterium halotolerans]